MEHYAAIDVSFWSSVCVVCATGQIVSEAEVPSEREAPVAVFAQGGFRIARIGLEAGSLSHWLYTGLGRAGCRRS
jgi:transposase